MKRITTTEIGNIVSKVLNESTSDNINGKIAVVSSDSNGIIEDLVLFSDVGSAEKYFFFKVDDFNMHNHLSDNDKQNILDDGVWGNGHKTVQIYHT